MSMAKSPTAMFHELSADVQVLADRYAALAKESERRTEAAEKQRQEIEALRVENAVLRREFDTHLKQAEEWDRRRWGLAGLFVATLLSFVANLIVAWVKK